MKFDAKGIPKWSQNRCQNSSTINAKTGNEKNQKHHQTFFSLKGKIMQIQSKNIGFESFAGCARERKKYRTNHQK